MPLGFPPALPILISKKDSTDLAYIFLSVAPGFFYNQMIPYRSWHQWKLMWVSTLVTPQMPWDMTLSPLP